MRGRQMGLCCLLAAVFSVMSTASGAEGERGYECLVQPLVEVSVSSAVPGVVHEIKVKRGDEVRKDQTLVRLVSGIERAAYDLAKARAEFAERRNERNVDLVEEKLISSNEKDEIETDALLAQLEMREALEVLRLRTIRSPITGVIADITIDPGERVGNDEMMLISQLDPLQVEVVVPVALYGSIQAGGKGIVRPETPFEGEFEATVTTVDRVVDAASGTFGVRLELPNGDGKLPAGLKCTVSFPGS